MADNETPAPAKPTKATTRATMAPAARNPAGDEEATREVLAKMSDDAFADLADAVRAEQTARGRRPREPKFGMTEGEREELERTGTSVSPFTGVVSHRPDRACKNPDATNHTSPEAGPLVRHEGACVKPMPPKAAPQPPVQAPAE